MEDKKNSHEEKKFVPTGAIAFFMLLVFLGIIIWLSAYLKYLVGIL